MTKVDGSLQILPELNRLYDPLHFVLLSPYGEEGYHRNLRQTNGKAMSPLMLYSYKHHIRPGQSNIIVRSGKLSQEYACCEMHKIEWCRLCYIEANQKKLKAETYGNVMDAMTANEDVTDIGRTVILPPSHYGEHLFSTWFLLANLFVYFKLKP